MPEPINNASKAPINSIKPKESTVQAQKIAAQNVQSSVQSIQDSVASSGQRQLKQMFKQKLNIKSSQDIEENNAASPSIKITANRSKLK